MPDIATTPDLSPAERLILDTLPLVEPAARSGALVSVSRLRRRLERDMTRAAFNFTLASLMDRGILAPHHHDHVASLTPVERDELVWDEGRPVIGVALR